MPFLLSFMQLSVTYGNVTPRASSHSFTHIRGFLKLAGNTVYIMNTQIISILFSLTAFSASFV